MDIDFFMSDKTQPKKEFIAKKVKFRVNFKVEYGEVLCVVGSINLLGNLQIKISISLEFR